MGPAGQLGPVADGLLAPLADGAVGVGQVPQVGQTVEARRRVLGQEGRREVVLPGILAEQVMVLRVKGVKLVYRGKLVVRIVGTVAGGTNLREVEDVQRAFLCQPFLVSRKMKTRNSYRLNL